MAATRDAVRGWDGKMSSLLAEAPACVAKVSYVYEDTIMCFPISKKCIDQTRNFRLRPDDMFIVTYPKTGTTWVQHIMLLVQVNADLSFFEGKHISKLVPFLETPDIGRMEFGMFKTVAEIDKAPTGVETADAMPTDIPRILKTHLDSRWLPEGLKEDPKAKVVYVARNPKDTAVSFYHFCELFTVLPDYASWDEFLEEFMAERGLSSYSYPIYF